MGGGGAKNTIRVILIEIDQNRNHIQIFINFFFFIFYIRIRFPSDESESRSIDRSRMCQIFINGLFIYHLSLNCLDWWLRLWNCVFCRWLWDIQIFINFFFYIFYIRIGFLFYLMIYFHRRHKVVCRHTKFINFLFVAR